MQGVIQAKLITLYCTVCDNHSIIEERMQRLSLPHYCAVNSIKNQQRPRILVFVVCIPICII